MNDCFLKLKKKNPNTQARGVRQNFLCLSVAFRHVQPEVAQFFVFFLCLMPSLLYVLSSDSNFVISTSTKIATLEFYEK